MGVGGRFFCPESCCWDSRRLQEPRGPDLVARGGACVHPTGTPTVIRLHPQGAISCLFPGVTAPSSQTGTGDLPGLECPRQDRHAPPLPRAANRLWRGAREVLAAKSSPHTCLGRLLIPERGSLSHNQETARNEAAAFSRRVGRTRSCRRRPCICVAFVPLPLSFLTVRSPL